MAVSHEMAGTTHDRRPRLEIVDLARALALVAMASYHFLWDLELFNYLPAGFSTQGWPRLYARGIASSFLFLVGVSLVLAHYPEIGTRKFLQRLGMIVAAAAAISVATYVFMPATFIFYGILHSIAVSSVLGLLFLRLPPLLTLASAAAVIVLPSYFRSEVFSAPWLIWTGLAPAAPRSNDFVPLFPWFGPVLAGIAFARAAERSGWFAKMALWQPAKGGAVRRFDIIGRHSLAFYLLHQPLLIGSLWVVSQFAPPDFEAAYRQGCFRACSETESADMCTRFCGCVTDRLIADGLFEGVRKGTIGPQSEPVATIADACTEAAQTPQ
jgi:Predicted membrane protein